jgi:hypothetical protein
MHSSILVSLVLATLAAATPTTRRNTSPGLESCQLVVPATDPSATNVIRSLGIVLEDVNVLVGINCLDVSVASPDGYVTVSRSSLTLANGTSAAPLSIARITLMVSLSLPRPLLFTDQWGSSSRYLHRLCPSHCQETQHQPWPRVLQPGCPRHGSLCC